MNSSWRNRNPAETEALPKYGPRAMLIGLALLLLLVIALLSILPWRGYQRRRREQAFDNIIYEAAARHGVPPLLVKAVICQESGFNPAAVGGKKEIGLMQITVPVVKDWERITGQKCPLYGLLFDPHLNIEIGAWYLARAWRRWEKYRDRDALALAQYNAGPENARRWAPEDLREKVLPRITFPSTRGYIDKVFEYRRRFEQEFADEKR